MKQINVTFTDTEHTLLLPIKGKLSWHDFIWTLYGWGNVRTIVRNAPELLPTEASEDFTDEYHKWLKDLKEATERPIKY